MVKFCGGAKVLDIDLGLRRGALGGRLIRIEVEVSDAS